MKHNPIICAIDVHNFDEAVSLIKEIYDFVGAIKLGLEFFIAFGIDGVKKIIEKFSDIKIFLDLKFHDIPNTVAGALQSIVGIKNIFLTTIHASGGGEMIQRSHDIVKNANSDLKIIAVTKLTSLEINQDEIINLTDIALTNHADGVVCPSEMSRILRNKFGDDFIIVNPGIRLVGSIIKGDDQKAITTPKIAIENGASYLVIGRPITQASNKKTAIEKILNELDYISE